MDVTLDMDNPTPEGAGAKPKPSHVNGATTAAVNGNGTVNGHPRDTEIDIEIPPSAAGATAGAETARLRRQSATVVTDGTETPPTRTASEEHPEPDIEALNPLTGSGGFSTPPGPTSPTGVMPGDEVLDQLTASPGATPTKATIVHASPIYQHCPCCPNFLATRSRLFVTTCCVLSLAAGVLLSICFFYPEGIFGVQAKLANQNQYPHKSVHHPHQNRYILHSPTAKRTWSSSSVYSPGGSGNNGAPAAPSTDTDDYDDESLASGAGHPYWAGGPVLNQGRQSSQLQMSSTKDVIQFSEITQTHNYSNVIQSRLLHFDLKGAPPTVSYMKEIMRLGKEAGITGVLMEWEDTFPWKGRLVNTTLLDEAGYSEEQVQELLDYAEQELQLEVIPLIQTFGHVEYILKNPQFFHLREDPNDPQSFCPSLPDTLEVVREMINQIAAVHKNAKFIHIGCDEVFNIGLCPLCTASRSGATAADRRSHGYDTVETLFLKHVSRVGEVVKAHGMIPIIWDDMLRGIAHEKLVEYKLSYFEPMVWVYAEDIDKFVNAEHWAKYSKIFATVWVAGAFKGAFGETLQLPPLQRHAENTQNWIEVVSRESSNWDYGIGGIVLTGWSRYDHFSVLCELLPASVPSLVYTSLILSIPSTLDSSIIKNRVFIPSDLNITHISFEGDDSSATTTSILAGARRRRFVRRKRSPEPLPLPLPGKKWVPHPQSLRINSAPIQTFSGSTHDVTPQNVGRSFWKTPRHSTTNMIEKYLHINSEFIRLLHCSFDKSIAEFELPLLVRDEEAAASGSTASSFISRCNFPGIQFYRSLLRLQVLQDEVWALDASLTRSRGWVGPYNQRHNFSSPYRINELVFRETPRFRRNLSQLAKTLANSLKRLYTGPTILEWIELNVWSAWEVLDKWEAVGDSLKAAKRWSRRPLPSPDRMVHDLGLAALQLYGGSDSSGRDEL